MRITRKRVLEVLIGLSLAFVPTVYALRCLQAYTDVCDYCSAHHGEAEFLLKPTTNSFLHFHQELTWISDDKLKRSTHLRCVHLLPGAPLSDACSKYCSSERQDVINHSLDWLVEQQNTDGLWGQGHSTYPLSGVVLSTLFHSATHMGHPTTRPLIEAVTRDLLLIALNKGLTLSVDQQAGLLIGLSDAANYYHAYPIVEVVSDYYGHFLPELDNDFHMDAAASLQTCRATTNTTTISNNRERALGEWMQYSPGNWRRVEAPLINLLKQSRLSCCGILNGGNPQLPQEIRHELLAKAVHKDGSCYWTPESLGISDQLAISGMTENEEAIYTTAMVLRLIIPATRDLPSFYDRCRRCRTLQAYNDEDLIIKVL